MTDDQLLRRIRAGDQSALEALMEKYRRYVYTIAANILGKAGTPADAEELTQDAFLAVWNHAGSIRPGKLKAYLTVTARNGAKSFLRSRRDLPMDLDEMEIPDDGDSLEERLIQGELGRKVRAAVHKMKPRDREIFLRYYYYLQTAEQISREMGIPSGTVRSCLVRGRKALKRALGEEGYI